MHDLSIALRGAIPNAHLSIDVPGIDRGETFDIARLNQLCDHIIVMGYDYYYGRSGTAGPVAPLIYDGTWRKEHIKATIESYITKGGSPEKILLGVPFYGYEWTTEADTLASRSISSGKPRFYSSIRDDPFFNQRKMDSHSSSAWISYQHDNESKQIWFDDSASLASKYEHVDTTGLGGIAIWALGYDGGHQEIWNGIVDAFVRVEKEFF
jgi:spore germination protein YaaH